MMCDWSSFVRGFAKWSLLIVNGLCITVALCTSAFAVVDMKILQQYGQSQRTGCFTSDVIILVTSSLLVAVATFGCYGALKGIPRILYSYVGFLMIFMVLELMVSVFVSVQRYGLEFRVSEWMRNDFFRNVTDDELVHQQKIWDDVQITYECCGLNGPEDYPAVRKEISLSCCKRAYNARTEYAQKQLYKNCLDNNSFFSEGCEEEILYTLRFAVDLLIGVAVICFWFEAIAIISAMWLANNMKQEVDVKKAWY